MKIETQRPFNRIVASVALFCMVMQPAYAIDLATRPLFLGPAVPPQVMLTMSKDQQLYKKAYNDYSDLDGDGDPERTYKHTVTYYGYFDPVKCYAYDTATNVFEPKSIVTDAKGVAVNAYCTDQWSGNFLNWISMSRMDAVRKLLYGGMRAKTMDTDSLTVLERAFIPPDAHAWAKHYDGADIGKLTPFGSNTRLQPFSATVTTTGIKLSAAPDDYAVTFSSAPSADLVQLGDQLKFAIDTNRYMTAPVLAISGSTVTVRIAAGAVVGTTLATILANTSWTVTNLSSTGISFCNLTPGISSDRSQTNTNPPQLRVARGNFSLWSANEVRQCQWHQEATNLQSGFRGVRSNGNLAALSNINASAENASKTYHGLGRVGTASQGQYDVRVKACVTDLFGTESCQQYPNGNFKPVGLLQQFGENNGIHFGLMTGSYANNTQGGVLRKNIGTFTDEVNLTTNGSFTGSAGIVTTLNNLRIYGYNYGTGTYLAAAPDGDSCNYQLIDIPANACTSWGNPMSEIYHEAIRYFAATKANQANSAYAPGAKDTALGLPNPQWSVPLDQSKVCSKLNVLVFNASVSTDEEDLASTRWLGNAANPTLEQLTNAVGNDEKISNSSYFVGKIVGTTATDNELCTAKTVTALGKVSGICPEGPTVRGTYLIAGAAARARSVAVRSDLSAPGSPEAMKIMSYGIQLATNTPQLNIPVPGQKGKFVVIQPIYRLVLTAGNGGGALVDMKYVDLQNTATRSSGKVYINWEDSEQGGDYDQDMWGTLEWVLEGGKLTVTTNAISASSANPQGFGYTVSGTTADGPHFHSGIYGFNFTDPTKVLGCTDCRHPSDPNIQAKSQKGATSVTYAVDLSRTGNTLKDPLWYLAKYGGYDKDGLWDAKDNATGNSGADQIPDNYFLVTNPLGLEKSLRAAFTVIGTTGSASAITADSTSISTGGAVYAAKFDANDWSGQFMAFTFDDKGEIDSTKPPAWEAGKLLPAANDRVIATYLNDSTRKLRKGVPFRWPAVLNSLKDTDIGVALIDGLSTIPEDTTKKDANGAKRLDYLRGDGTNEGTTGSGFRPRKTKLGDIANSSPAFVPSIPSDPIIDAGYSAFRQSFLGDKPTRTRPAMVYVGANDGMLHGFEAAAKGGGKERLAYVPSKTFGKLNQLTSRSYIHQYYVDGTPAVADAFVKNEWRTVLVGSLGSGGRGIYALDVTTVPEPGAGAEAKLASQVLWEFNVEDDVPKEKPAASDPQPYGLGYVLGQPLIRKMSDGRWAAIVSSGYNNTEAGATRGDGKGYIYIIFLDGPTGTAASGGLNTKWVHGTDYIRLETGTGTLADGNGMAPPITVDYDLDGKVDFIYAGDLFGDFWKFDVTAAKGDPDAASKWNDARRRVALFKGGRSQPITSAAEAMFHPTQKGFILLFGTGKYLEEADRLPKATGSPFATQSFYGIWDRNNGANGEVSKQTGLVERQTNGTVPGLLQQVLAEEATAHGVFRTIVGDLQPDWSKQSGWYIDFLNSSTTGERDVSPPLLVSKRLVFSTIVPETGTCDKGGKSYLMVVNPATGGAFSNAVLDTNGDRVINNTTDRLQGGYAVGIQVNDLITTPAVFSGGGAGSRSETTLVDSSAIGRVAGGVTTVTKNFIWSNSGGSLPKLPFGAGPDSGRATWREVVPK